MAKAMRNTKRAEKKLLENRKELVKAAMEAGKITRSDICKAAGISLSQLVNLFTADRALFAEYSVMRRTITDQAADNIHAIINDPKHPQHFAASKYVLQNYKSDFDEILESQEESMLQIETPVDTTGQQKPVRITFTGGRLKD